MNFFKMKTEVIYMELHFTEAKNINSVLQLENTELLKNVSTLICEYTEEKPVLLVIGGSLGSVAINNAIRSNIDALLEKYQIIHLCGRNNLDESLEGREGLQTV